MYVFHTVQGSLFIIFMDNIEYKISICIIIHIPYIIRLTHVEVEGGNQQEGKK